MAPVSTACGEQQVEKREARTQERLPLRLATVPHEGEGTPIAEGARPCAEGARQALLASLVNAISHAHTQMRYQQQSQEEKKNTRIIHNAPITRIIS